jgi:hypothetical protein
VIEADVKKSVKEIIKELAPNSHQFWPVQSGFGKAHLDVDVKINGFALVIETKVAGRGPTARQISTINDLDRSGTPVLVIDQLNLEDVCVVINYLLRGQQGPALAIARVSREWYGIEAKVTTAGKTESV